MINVILNDQAEVLLLR